VTRREARQSKNDWRMPFSTMSLYWLRKNKKSDCGENTKSSPLQSPWPQSWSRSGSCWPCASAPATPAWSAGASQREVRIVQLPACKRRECERIFARGTETVQIPGFHTLSTRRQSSGMLHAAATNSHGVTEKRSMTRCRSAELLVMSLVGMEDRR
jgi:hypothetical protein